MFFVYLVPLFCVSFVFPPILAADDVRYLNETLKQEATKGYVGQISSNATGKIVENSKQDQISKHMLELYEMFKLQDIEGDEIIRSIEPAKDDGSLRIKDIIIFNMSAISSNEKIKTAYLHIHRKKLSQYVKATTGRKKILPSPCKMRLYHVLVKSLQDVENDRSNSETTKLRSLDSVLLTQVMRGGWHTIDISMALKEMFDSPSSTSPAIFGVRFEGPKGKSISPQHFLKDMRNNMTSSFILVHSEESDESKVLNAEKNKNGKSDINSKLIADMLESVERASQKKRKYDKEGVKDADTKAERKKKTKKPKPYGMDPIRHERKYYRENKIHKQKENERITSNDVPLDTNHFVPAPGEGDIVELLDFERVEKLNRLRRHNHRAINPLNLSYDAATKRIIEKKHRKSRHKKNESYNRRRSDLPETNESAAKTGNVFQKQEVVFRTSDSNAKLFATPTKKGEELYSEDDMGDLNSANV